MGNSSNQQRLHIIIFIPATANEPDWLDTVALVMAENTDNKHNTEHSTRHSAKHSAAGDKIVAAFAWVESPASVVLAIKILAGLCALLFLLDLIIHRHTYVPGEGLWGFYAFTGFIAFTLIVLGAKQLRSWILRGENYYGVNSVDSEEYPVSQLDIQSVEQGVEHGIGKDDARSTQTNGQESAR